MFKIFCPYMEKTLMSLSLSSTKRFSAIPICAALEYTHLSNMSPAYGAFNTHILAYVANNGIPSKCIEFCERHRILFLSDACGFI